MRNIILLMLATLFVAGCSDSDGASGLVGVTPNEDTTISVDVGGGDDKPPTDVDNLQACVALDAISITDVSGKVIEWTVKSMSDPYGVNSVQCIPPDSSIPIDHDGYPKFIVIDLYALAGIDLVNLLSEQLIPVGKYTSIGLSVVQGSYGDLLGSPYSYIGNMVDKQALEIVDELTVDGLDINIDAPETFIMAFDFRSMFHQLGAAFKMKDEGLRLVAASLSGRIYGDIDTSSCPVIDDAYVYLYGAGSQYGDLGSGYAPVTTVKVKEDNTYEMPYVSEGSYDVVLVCDGLLDLPDQIDLDIDLDGDSPKHTGVQLDRGEDIYLPL